MIWIAQTMRTNKHNKNRSVVLLFLFLPFVPVTRSAKYSAYRLKRDVTAFNIKANMCDCPR